jgi:hypothetical protein
MREHSHDFESLVTFRTAWLYWEMDVLRVLVRVKHHLEMETTLFL